MRESANMLGIAGDAWDIAHAVLYFASDESRYVTAHTMPVDAGVLRTTASSLATQIREMHEEELREDGKL
jgi:NAD(P)-dependent dehydrogenase (short-subunit alcohol dehydrogenase family)